MEAKQAQFWEELKSGKFLSMVKESSRGQSLGSSQEVFNILKPLFAKEDDVEKMFFVFLDRKNKVLAIENLFSGSLTGSFVYPREIMKRILSFKAAALVMAHNHPSGDPTPSREDLSITLYTFMVVHSIGVQLLDHVIIGDTYYSMAEEGNLKKIKQQVDDFYKGGPYEF